MDLTNQPEVRHEQERLLDKIIEKREIGLDQREAAPHTVGPKVITVDKNAAYPKALKELKATGDLAAACELRQSQYLNKLIEQDHRFLKRLVKPGVGFFSFETAGRTLQEYKALNMMRKGQMRDVNT